VCRATAVGCPKARHRHASPRQPRHLSGPAVFEAGGIGRIPDLDHVAYGPEKVDVPVGAGGDSKVMAEPGLQSAWAEGAADVGVEARLQLHGAEPANL